jgi:hypothetical protein
MIFAQINCNGVGEGRKIARSGLDIQQVEDSSPDRKDTLHHERKRYRVLIDDW